MRGAKQSIDHVRLRPDLNEARARIYLRLTPINEQGCGTELDKLANPERQS